MGQHHEHSPADSGGLAIAVVIIFFILLPHYAAADTALLLLACLLLCIPARNRTAHPVYGSLAHLCARSGVADGHPCQKRDSASRLCRRAAQSGRECSTMLSSTLPADVCALSSRTSAAATMGVFPMVTGDSALWKPMGVVIFWGTPVTMYSSSPSQKEGEESHRYGECGREHGFEKTRFLIGEARYGSYHTDISFDIVINDSPPELHDNHAQRHHKAGEWSG